MMNPKLLKTILSCFLIFIGAVSVSAQEISRTENFTNFSGISVSSGIDIYLTQSNAEKIVVKGTKDLMSRLKVSKSNDGMIKFEFEKDTNWGNWNFGKNNYVKAYVSFKTLNSMMASGGADVYSEGDFKLNHLAIKSSGGSDIKLNLNVTDLKVMSSGGSDVYLRGKANQFSVQASGGSDVHAFDLMVDDLVVKMSGGSDGDFTAEKSVSIAASGASDVRYKGAATQKSISASGASDVKKVN
ncbi:MAG: DUF2807 domain-containing protein [Sphingobacteriales bacterium]|nr:DUF2807 domain-containing protein [Sphingobacteriales bacterium]